MSFPIFLCTVNLGAFTNEMNSEEREVTGCCG